MQFLRTLFWVVVAAVGVIFAYRNWVPAEIQLWGGLEADVKLPLLMLFAFLIGFVPVFVLHKATRWRFKRKLDNMQRALEEARAQLAHQSGVSEEQDGMTDLLSPSGSNPKLL